MDTFQSLTYRQQSSPIAQNGGSEPLIRIDTIIAMLRKHPESPSSLERSGRLINIASPSKLANVT
jgi:hypothetical protein